MKQFRVSIVIDIQARTRGEAHKRAEDLYDLIGRAKPWIIEVLPDGIQEREVLR